MAVNKTKQILNSMVWSFSSINSYSTCPKMFYLTYIKKVDKVQNAFAIWGSYIHGILEKYYLGELELFELSEVYERDYDTNITITFPDNAYKDLNESYRTAGKKYFDNFEDDFSEYQVIGVEQGILMQIDKYDFTGYIDLILKNEKGYYICDHKSKSGFKSKAEQRHYLFQLYLYSKYIYETYGEYPVGLIFNMFRAGEIIEEEFSLQEYEKALSWAKHTINMVYEDKSFEDKILTEYLSKKKTIEDYKNPDFFCTELCSPRKSCPRSKIKSK